QVQHRYRRTRSGPARLAAGRLRTGREPGRRTGDGREHDGCGRAAGVGAGSGGPSGTADIVVLGGLNVDVRVHTPRLPRPGETVEAADVTTTPGGKGANQAIAAARAHEGPGSVAIAGLVGDDTYGEALVAFLRDEGVDVECVGIETGCATG